MKSIIVVFLVGTLFTVGLEALQCYRCGVPSSDATFQPGDDASCATTPVSQMNKCNTTAQSAQCMTAKAANIVVQKTCSDACVELNALGSGTWCCNSNLCNNAPTITVSIFTMSTAVLLAVLGIHLV